MVLRIADDAVDGTEQHARKWEDNLLMDGFTHYLMMMSRPDPRKTATRQK